MNVLSPMPQGSGAIVVHRMLEKRLRGYSVVPYDPRLEYCPPLMRWVVPRPPADVIHTTPDHAVCFKRSSAPLVATFHNLVIDDFMQAYSSTLQKLHYRTDLRWYLRRGVSAATKLTAVSQFTADLARQELSIGADIEVIPNGVETERFVPATAHREGRSLRLLFAGNPSYRKGAHWLPEIAERLEGEDRIVCATGLRGQWRSFLTHPRIEILGGIRFDEMPTLYQSVDALLLPTVREGDSLVVLEAMSCGLPVIATDCASLGERVAHERGGYLCRLGKIGDFADAIKELRDPTRRQQMGSFNRDRAVSEFDVDVMSTRYRTLFDSLAKS
ncbi:MAG: glycosyltransferase family 4 protein [Pseudomonadota bacterium]